MGLVSGVEKYDIVTILKKFTIYHDKNFCETVREVRVITKLKVLWEEDG